MDEHPDEAPPAEGPGDDRPAAEETAPPQDSGQAAAAPAEGGEAAPEHPPSAQWYYAVGGVSYGPVDEERLKALARQGYFQKDDFVFSSYLGDWVRADSVYGLFEEAAAPVGVIEAGVAPPPAGTPQGLRYATQYAGFWIRFAAVIIDGLVLMIPSCFIFMAFFSVFGMFAARARAPFPLADADSAAAVVLPLTIGAGVIALSIVMTWLYYSLMESSRWQATLGKRAVGIIVTDAGGNPISWARATGRYFASILSSMILNIGYIMGAFTERKQTLHDMIADTVVVYGRAG